MFERFRNGNGYEICPGAGNVCFVDIRRKKGWKEYENALNASGGIGVVMTHPLYNEVSRVLAVDTNSVPYLSRYLKDYESCFNSYRNRVRNMFRNRQFSRLPIFILNDPHVKLEELIPFFGLENVTDKRRIFFATTHPTSPIPEFEVHLVEEPMLKFTQKLHKLGLKKAIVAGTYFGGAKSFGNEYLPAKNENQNLPQTTLKQIEPDGCVGSVITSLANSGVITVCTNATFPQILPGARFIYRFDFGETEKSELLIDVKSKLGLGAIIPDDIY